MKIRYQNQKNVIEDTLNPVYKKYFWNQFDFKTKPMGFDLALTEKVKKNKEEDNEYVYEHNHKLIYRWGCI